MGKLQGRTGRSRISGCRSYDSSFISTLARAVVCFTRTATPFMFHGHDSEPLLTSMEVDRCLQDDWPASARRAPLASKIPRCNPCNATAQMSQQANHRGAGLPMRQLHEDNGRNRHNWQPAQREPAEIRTESSPARYQTMSHAIVSVPAAVGYFSHFPCFGSFIAWNAFSSACHHRLQGQAAHR